MEEYDNTTKPSSNGLTPEANDIRDNAKSKVALDAELEFISDSEKKNIDSEFESSPNMGYGLDGQIVNLTYTTLRHLISLGADATSLYMFYIKNYYHQKQHPYYRSLFGRTWATESFCLKGLKGMGRLRFRNAKKLLVENGLIVQLQFNAKIKGKKNKKTKSYVYINFLPLEGENNYSPVVVQNLPTTKKASNSTTGAVGQFCTSTVLNEDKVEPVQNRPTNITIGKGNITIGKKKDKEEIPSASDDSFLSIESLKKGRITEHEYFQAKQHPELKPDIDFITQKMREVKPHAKLYPTTESRIKRALLFKESTKTQLANAIEGAALNHKHSGSSWDLDRLDYEFILIPKNIDRLTKYFDKYSAIKNEATAGANIDALYEEMFGGE